MKKKSEAAVMERPTEKQLRNLMEQPIDPTKDYFDATAAMLEMADKMRGMENRMADLERALALQAGINGKLLDNMNQVLLSNAKVLSKEEPANGLILPERLTN